MKYYIKIWIAETVLHFVNGRCCLLVYTICMTQKTNNQGSEKVKVSCRHYLPSWFFKTRLFPKVRKFIFWKLATKVTVSYMRFFGVQTGRQTDKLSVCLLLACVSVCVSVSVCLPVHIVSSLNCLRDLELSSIQNGTDGAFSEPCKK